MINQICNWPRYIFARLLCMAQVIVQLSVTQILLDEIFFIEKQKQICAIAIKYDINSR